MTVLACLVVFCTTYALILPAITLEKPAGDAAVLVCTTAELGTRVHTDACYGQDDELVCGYADFVVHTHENECYNEDGTLACSLPEVEAHTHTADCYAAPQAATPETAQAEGEAAGPVLTCGKQEIEPHIHTEECYNPQGALACGKLQIEEHVHNESCFAAPQDEAATPETAETSLTFRGEGFMVTAVFGPEAGLPADARLAASIPEESDGAYNELGMAVSYALAQQSGALNAIYPLAIRFEDAEGQTLAPAAPRHGCRGV